jgi:hypothetical protein
VGNLFSGRSAGGFSKLLSGNTGSLIAGGAGLLTGALSGGQPETTNRRISGRYQEE